MQSRYERVLEKYQWANQHIDQLETAIDEFRRENPHSIGIRHNAEGTEIAYYVISVPQIPSRIGFILGDAVHNLRSTLDHLAYALVSTTGSVPDKQTYFPIGDCAKDFPSVLGSRIKGLGQHCIEAIKRIQPYKGGWGHWAWQLHQLDIVDKHRLVLTVATVPVGRSMTPSEIEAFNRRQSLVGPHAHTAIQYSKAANSTRIRGLEAGDILGTFPISDVDENMGFSFDVAINEPEIIGGTLPTFFLLRMFRSGVMEAINALAQFL